MLRRHHALQATPGLITGRLFMAAELDTTAGGTPIPTRWGLLCGWEDADARDAFFRRGAPVFTTGATEAWGASLETVRVVQGDLGGWSPTVEGAERLARDEPLASPHPRPGAPAARPGVHGRQPPHRPRHDP